MATPHFRESGDSGQSAGGVSEHAALDPRFRGDDNRRQLDLSIIIVNRNTRALLEACLSSIEELPDEVALEVILVDNASSDGSVEMVESRFPSVRLIRNSINAGFAAPNNQGIAISTGRYLMLLNSDTEVRPRALERLVAFMDAHPTAGACGPLLRYPDGRPQPSWLSFHTPWRCFCEMVGLGALFSRSRWFANQERLFDPSRRAEVEALMGAALVVRRQVLEQIGPLDERFRIHANETDWCFRMAQQSWARYFVPEAEVVHHLGATLRIENAGLELQPEMLRNLFDYYRKHYGLAGLAWFRFWMAGGFGARWVWYRLRSRGGGGDERNRGLAARSRLMFQSAFICRP